MNNDMPIIVLSDVDNPDTSRISVLANGGVVRFQISKSSQICEISQWDALALRNWLTKWLDEREPATPSYDENVTRLVEAAHNVVGDQEEYNAMESLHGGPISWKSIDNLHRALAPFLPPPDPDAELVEKMATEASHLPSPWTFDSATAPQVNRSNMRALLTVVRAHDKETP